MQAMCIHGEYIDMKFELLEFFAWYCRPVEMDYTRSLLLGWDAESGYDLCEIPFPIFYLDGITALCNLWRSHTSYVLF